MSDTEIVLFPGTLATDDPDEKWLPSLTLDHDADRRELYVIVCEEAAGMAEGVPVEVFEAVRARLDRQRDVAAILGLLPSGSGWEGRALYLAYLIATGSPEDQVAEAREAVETLRPGWLNRVRELRAKVAVGA